MTWQVFGPMMRRQERVSAERREDRERRVDRLRERRTEAGPEVEEPHRTCAACGKAHPPPDLCLADDGSEVCVHCERTPLLASQATRSLSTLGWASVGVSTLAVGLGGFSAIYLPGELNLGLTALALGLISVATGWSSIKRARDLVATLDLLRVPSKITARAKLFGSIAIIAGVVASCSWPAGLAGHVAAASVGLRVPIEAIRPDPAHALRPQLDGRPAGSEFVDRLKSWNESSRDSYERNAEALEDQRQRWKAFQAGDLEGSSGR